MSAAVLQSRPERRSRLRGYLALTKPRILPLVIFTALPVLGMAGDGWPSLPRGIAILLGITVAAAAANVLNMYAERERDARMERTRLRPLPSALLEPAAALRFGIALSLLSSGGLYAVAGAPAALWSAASILFYVFVYTLWWKPRSPYNAVIGGAAGAAAPLIADAAMNGSIGWAGLLLFSIVFLWQPPHVWAIAMYRRDDYAAGGIPMMPAVIGQRRTLHQMLAYTVGLVAVSLLPSALGLLGGLYTVSALLLGAGFFWSQIRLLRERSDAAARRVFVVSLAYLSLLYLSMLADLLLA